MKLSLNWLNTMVKAPDPKTYADKMTMAGNKVEMVTELSTDIKNVVVGLVLSIERHPQADKLFVCSVDVGKGEPVQIITGATNVVAGAYVPACLDGAVLPGGKEIRSGLLRGLLSDGMLCSFKELGLVINDVPNADAEGIYLLDPAEGPYTIGEDIVSALKLHDTVVDFEITNNRPDCLSVRGLARETSAVFGSPLTLAKPVVKAGHGDVTKSVSVEIADPNLCNRYTAKMVKNVVVKPSPLWLRRYLRASGLRSINNIVDITNYVLLEYGQPLHAFDFACVEGGKIIVRTAKSGEVLQTLDGQDRALTTDMLVIADSNRPVAVAGVMGGANSEITEKTTTILFESANFNGASVRKTALTLNMRTDASSRFEKGLDATTTVEAVERACELVELLGAGDVLDGVVDVYPVVAKEVRVPFLVDRINSLLGTDINRSEMAGYLETLGFVVEGDFAIAPSWRNDIEIFEDLAEEVARLYGYDKIPTTMNDSKTIGTRTPWQNNKVKAAALLRSLGFSEMLTYSFIGKGFYDAVNMDAGSPVSIINPLGEETALMRTTAIPSICSVLSRNYALRNPLAYLYELAMTYKPNSDGLPDERIQLLFGFYDTVNVGNDNRNFFTLKGSAEALLASFRVKNVSFTAHSEPTFHPGRCARVYSGDVLLGVLGQLHPTVAEKLDIDTDAYVCELDFSAMLDNALPETKFTQLPKYPAITRDLALLCDKEVPSGVIKSAIEEAGGALLTDCKLFDVYTGIGVAPDKKSIAFSLQFRADRTLVDAEADDAIKNILSVLEEKHKIFLRK